MRFLQGSTRGSKKMHSQFTLLGRLSHAPVGMNLLQTYRAWRCRLA